MIMTIGPILCQAAVGLISLADDCDLGRRGALEMKAEEFCKAINALGLTSGEAAVLLDVHPRTTRRWANREREIPGPVSSFLNYLVRRRTKGRNAIRELGRKTEALAA